MNRMLTVMMAALGTALVTALSPLALAGPLKVAEQMPDLGGKVNWLKGEESLKFEEGTVYVLDFWATWCAPCIQAMPHVNELAEMYRDDDVEVIGVAVFEQAGQAPTDRWVERKGDEISYAMVESVDGAVEEAILRPLGVTGIPTIAIVDRSGRLAWTGHPYEMDRVLERVVANVDVAGLLGKSEGMLREANKLAQGGDWDGALQKLEDVIALDHSLFGNYAVNSYGVQLVRLKREEEAATYGRTIIENVINESPDDLANLAYFIVSKPLAERDLKLAAMAIERAQKLRPDDSMLLDIHASVLHMQGDAEGAVKTQERAIELAEDDAERSRLKAKLTEYAAAK